MSRVEKIKKLGNAIREFRGLKHGNQFICTAKPRASLRIVKWLRALGHDERLICAEIQIIKGFKTTAEFHAWIRDLDKPSPLSTAAVMGGAA